MILFIEKFLNDIIMVQTGFEPAKLSHEILSLAPLTARELNQSILYNR